MNPFFDDLGRRLASAAADQGAEVEPPALDPGVAAELLELARVAAHTQERRFAPLASFMAGMAAEGLRASGKADPQTVAAVIAQVRRELES